MPQDESPMGCMTLEDLRRMVAILSNSACMKVTWSSRCESTWVGGKSEARHLRFTGGLRDASRAGRRRGRA